MTLGEGEAETVSARQVLVLERRLLREKQARLEAETIAEAGLRNLYERQRQLELVASIAAEANTADAPEAALTYALRAICEFTGWEFGHAFVLSEDGARLRSARLHFAREPNQVTAFIKRSYDSEFEKGRGLPGRVWSSGSSIWIDDVTRDANFPRAAVASASSLHAAFAFPLLVGHEVQGVMELFHSQPLALDDMLLNLASHIGTHLGRVLERAAARKKLLFEASHDALTGLANRARFTEAVRSSSTGGIAGTVLAMDLDGFKAVNDTLGHSAGDQVLVEVSNRLRDCVAAGVTISRLGGDEFAIFLPESNDPISAAHVADCVLTRMSEPFVIGADEIYLGASIGISFSPLHGADVEELLSAADLALYQAKGDGRQCRRFFSPGLRRAVVLKQQQETELRRAVESAEFELAYQPQVRANDGVIIGAEALLRWRHPERGLLSPAAFMATLETGVLAAEVGTWVLRTACRQAAEWRGRNAPDFRIGVNLFGAQFRTGDLSAVVRSVLGETELAPEALELEITENIILLHDDAMTAPLRELRDEGVGIAFDDYGTGYASLSLLKRYPLTRLKVDQTFVRNMCENARDEAIVGSVIQLGQAFELSVIAEGVETTAQRAKLIDKGCNELQGYLFGRPMPASEFEELMTLSGAARPHRTGWRVDQAQPASFKSASRL